MHHRALHVDAPNVQNMVIVAAVPFTSCEHRAHTPWQPHLPSHPPILVLPFLPPTPPTRYQEAVLILLEVIRSVPNLRDPYRTLGALHEVRYFTWLHAHRPQLHDEPGP
jgi:hypothetical protein